ncbi:hypothetical protein [Aliihoeflea sp. PC F10.4]
MRRILHAAALGMVLSVPAPAMASDADFLTSLAGEWSGGGEIRRNPDENPINVNCNLSSSADTRSVMMEGACTAAIIVSRRIGASLIVDNGSYSGSYVGSTHGEADLSGSRSGDTVNLSVLWPEVGREATMTVSASGNTLQIVTIEERPDTGEQVVTAQLSFQRQ